MRKLSIILVMAISCLLVVSCATNPMTKRRNIKIIPEKILIKNAARAYKQELKKHKICTDNDRVAMVQSVAENLIQATNHYLEVTDKLKLVKHYNWEVTLVEDERINASVLPGGKIIVNTGLLPFAKNEDGLAAILGHEIGHAIARHGNEKISRMVLLNLGATGLDVFLSLKNVSVEIHHAIQRVYGWTAVYGAFLPYSRKLEKEADEMGIYLAAMAGYSPEEAPKVWARIAKDQKRSQNVFRSTHPSSEERMVLLTSQIPKAHQYAMTYGVYKNESPRLKDPIKSLDTLSTLAIKDYKPVRSASDNRTASLLGSNTLTEVFPKADIVKMPSAIKEQHLIDASREINNNTLQKSKESKNLKSIGGLILPQNVSIKPKTNDGKETSSYYKIQVLATPNLNLKDPKLQAVKHLGDFHAEYLKERALYRVLLGNFSTAHEARTTIKTIKQISYKDAFIVEYRGKKRVMF